MRAESGCADHQSARAIRRAALQGWRYVIAPQAAPQGRQGAPLLEQCRRTAGSPAAGSVKRHVLLAGRASGKPIELHGAGRSRRSTRAGRPAGRSRCSPRIVRRRHWLAMWCRSGSAACGCAGPGNGADVGWRAICGSNLSWMSSGRRVPPSRRGTRWLGGGGGRGIRPGGEKDNLYRCLDKLLAHKTDLFSFLQQRWKTLFEAKLKSCSTT